MSSITVSNLSYIEPEALADRLRVASKPLDSSPISIIDVRDSDFIGGHIRGCMHVPSNELDYRLPELVRVLQSKSTVVFHCALSQQRGPSAAVRYLRERERLLKPTQSSELSNAEVSGPLASETPQEVLVLNGGFVKWQEEFGKDTDLTEGWQKSIWEFGY